ncbi:ATP-grasp domain-containing protein [Pseudomonas alcaligenes]|jgi:carbamoyl-phosphate synthase large subunit|uniref:ATP-grasp domain-containing protein n=1 Tax=Pseudomonadaceae TaxID=135621 RepID=UPI0014761310|nr:MULTISPECIES: ATP-grasp domain-containing protein [Pseudomonas]MEE1949593.1 ATP-grasp domain-containing protein [Pseudomonas alcaligenes]NMY40034.1 ATP-grasp domain-containing protein [Pseudomonas sp. WS 5013]
MNVLVSGIAGDIGFGIARILREWGVFSRLHGIDIHADHPGHLMLDQCAVAPRASDDEYIPWLSNYISDNRIGLFIPSSEAELGRLVAAGLDEVGGAIIVRNSNFTVLKSLDKSDCLAHLAGCGVAVPENGLIGGAVPSEYPVIVKPRSGQGSKGVRLVESAAQLEQCQPGWVWQQYLLPDDQEYTCPVYASPKTGMRILVIKRKLIGGLTGSGVVVDNRIVEEYVRSIADVMQLDGAINIQLRLTENGPLLFEINPRLSSTLVFRDKMGFTDLRWWVADKLGLSAQAYCAPKAGTRFYRGAQEYISTL